MPKEGILKLSFEDEGIEITMIGTREQVEEYAGRLQKSRGGQGDLGKLLQIGSNPDILEQVVESFPGGKKYSKLVPMISANLGKVWSFLKGMGG